MTKVFISAQQLLDDAYELATQVVEDDFQPTCVVALWRGGTPVGVAVHEMLRYCGIYADHFAIRTSLYAAIDERKREVVVDGLEMFREQTAQSRVLLVDDVFDTGLTMQAVLKILESRTPLDPANIRIAVPWYKPSRNRTALKPHYYLRESEDWLVFPHELCGLDAGEIRQKGGRAAALLQRLGK